MFELYESVLDCSDLSNGREIYPPDTKKLLESDITNFFFR